MAMQTVLATVLAAALLGAAGYAQLRIAQHTRGRGRVLAARLALLATGIAFGYVAAVPYAFATTLPAPLVFAIAFGLVHVPAAIILFVKARRGAGKS